jgi:hypothetical protein
MRNTTLASWASPWLRAAAGSLACLALACGSPSAQPTEPRASIQVGAAGGAESERPRVQEEGPEAAYDAAMEPQSRTASPSAPASLGVGSSGNIGPVGGQTDIGKAQVQPTTTTQPGGQTRPPLSTVQIKPTGIPVCDDYLTALRACVMQMPGPQRAAMEESIRQTAGAFASGAQTSSRPAMEDSCRQAHEQIKGSCFKR